MTADDARLMAVLFARWRQIERGENVGPMPKHLPADMIEPIRDFAAVLEGVSAKKTGETMSRDEIKTVRRRAWTALGKLFPRRPEESLRDAIECWLSISDQDRKHAEIDSMKRALQAKKDALNLRLRLTCVELGEREQRLFAEIVELQGKVASYGKEEAGVRSPDAAGVLRDGGLRHDGVSDRGGAGERSVVASTSR